MSKGCQINITRHFGYDYNSILDWKFQLFCELRLSQSYMITIVFTVADDVTVTQWQFFEISIFLVPKSDLSIESKWTLKHGGRGRTNVRFCRRELEPVRF